MDRTKLNEQELSAEKATKECMCGDVNVFLSLDDETNILTGEIEIMVTEKDSRGKGVATEALWLMMRYCMDNLSINRFEAKILDHNNTSLDLFRRKMHFKDLRHHKVFQEYWLEYNLDETNRQQIIEETKHIKISQYE